MLLNDSFLEIDAGFLSAVRITFLRLQRDRFEK